MDEFLHQMERIYNGLKMMGFQVPTSIGEFAGVLKHQQYLRYLYFALSHENDIWPHTFVKVVRNPKRKGFISSPIFQRLTFKKGTQVAMFLFFPQDVWWPFKIKMKKWTEYTNHVPTI